MSTLKAKGCLFLASSLCDGLEDNDIKQVTTLLLNKDANPNTLIPTYGVTPFHLVIGNDSEPFAEEVTKLFLRHGGNPNVRSIDGLTPVHVAAAWGRVTVLELLLANGGDPLCLDDEGRSPFHYAFDGKYYKAIVLLGKYCENSTKEESVSYKITFDKLLVSTGNLVAEYTVPQIPITSAENILIENMFKGQKNVRFSDIKHSCNIDGNRANGDHRVDMSAAELQIREEINKEKCLVNKIINQLSNSLKSNSKEDVDKEYKESEQTLYNSSPSSTLNRVNNIAYYAKDEFSFRRKPKKLSTTPKYRRRAFGQNHSTKIPLLPMYDPSDSIISKSPNFIISTSEHEERKYSSPKTLNKQTKFKSLTPCMTRNQSFRSEEFNIRKEVARSTPRRRKRFYRQYSFNRKLRENDKQSLESTSAENTSLDSMNSVSPDQCSVRKLNFNIDDLAIKLDESKYDDDKLVDCKENKTCIKTSSLSNNLLEGLNNNFTNLKINKNFKEGKKENINDYVLQDICPYEEEKLKTSSTANTFKENLGTLLSSFRSESCISVQEEYTYESVDEGVAFLERRIYTLPPCKALDCTGTNKQWPQSFNLSMNMSLTDEALRRKLINIGDNPGPITNTTRQLYLKRLVNMKNEKYNSSLAQIQHSNASSKMPCCENQIKPFLIYGDWMNDLGRYKIIEKNAFKEFSLASPCRKWRGGMNKTCFNYLLLDPRLTRDLPSCAENLSKSTVWSMFLSAIFYIGKGTRNRPYSHLKDAFDAWVSNKHSDSKKIQHILSIWNEGYGVVCLHVFQNSIPVESYTREAAMIDALGLQILKNCKSGDYYGIAATWNVQEKCNFGRYLLHQALQIFLYEGERQIFPQNL